MDKKDEYLDSCEIIELTIDNIELLTRTFRFISEACEQNPGTVTYLDWSPPEYLIN